jgi:hypothetical protein
MDSREIDRLVAEKVMGWKLVTYGTDKYLKREDGSAFKFEKWSPTANIMDAMMALEQFDNYSISKGIFSFDKVQKYCVSIDTPEETFTWWGTNLAKTICITMLKAKGIDVEI